jgi:hypothetical protein
MAFELNHSFPNPVILSEAYFSGVEGPAFLRSLSCKCLRANANFIDTIYNFNL